MDKAVKFDNPADLFEPMSQEALERLKQDFPLNEPLSPEKRKEAADWLLSPDGGGVSVKLQAPYDNPKIKTAIIESMLLNSWFTPDRKLGGQIPLQALSLHRVGSSTIPISLDQENTRQVNVVIKPFHSKHSKADTEIDRFKELKNRGIPTVDPLGTIDINDQVGHETFGLTILKTGIVPLQKINIESLQSDPKTKFRQLKDFLNGLSTFMADLHNKGVAHGDLHLGNIAMDLNQGVENEFLIYDLESSTIMAPDKLGIKTKQTPETVNKLHMKKFGQFETSAVSDIANMAADMQARNSNLPYDTILYNFVLPYLNARTASVGLPTKEDFIARFDLVYKKKLQHHKKIVEWARKNMPKNS